MQGNKPINKFFRNVVINGEDKTIPDLAITPSQMMMLAEQGIPISNHQLNQFYDNGEVNPSWDVPLDRQRGVDVVHMWEHNQNVKKKIKDSFVQSQKTE